LGFAGQLRGGVVVGILVADDAPVVEFVDLENLEALEEAEPMKVPM
jgi:hypothetical protein